MKRFLPLILATLSAFSGLCAERDVTIHNRKAGITLGGTLAVPDQNAPSALFVLVTGSGAQNRDEEIMGHRPFKVISDALVSAGYGVLRMDDRGVGESGGNFSDALLADFADDALAGVDFMRETYPSTKTGILGHSQGGEIAIMAAAKEKVDFIVTLAAPAWKGDSLIMAQCRALAVASTGSWPNEKLQRNLLDIAMSDLPDFVAKPLLANEFFSVMGYELAKVSEVRDNIYRQVAPLLLPSYKELLRYDPTDDIVAVKVPWIALNGTLDLQVPVKNLDTISQLNPKATVVPVEGHNHLFQKAVTGLPDEYPTAGQTPSDETLKILLDEINNLL